MTYRLDMYPIQQRIDSKLIGSQIDKGTSLKILTYTHKCEGLKSWDKWTELCRGLIVDTDTARVVCQTFPKFHNVNRQEMTKVENLPDEVPIITEKLDGSFLQVFNYQGKWRVSTKASFENIYTDYAYENLPDMSSVAVNKVFACEVVLPIDQDPQRRPVVHQPGVYFLAAFDKYNFFKELPFERERGLWMAAGGRATTAYTDQTIPEMIEATKSLQGVEGWVVHYPYQNLRLKVKTLWYFYLSAYTDLLNEKSIKEMMIAHQDYTQGDEIWLGNFPREYKQEAKRICQDIRFRYSTEYDRLVAKYKELEVDDRKLFSEFAKDDPNAWALYRMYDRQDFAQELLENI